MYRRLPTILILVIFCLAFLTAAQSAFASLSQHSLQTIILRKITRYQQTVTPQIAQISIGQAKVAATPTPTPTKQPTPTPKVTTTTTTSTPAGSSPSTPSSSNEVRDFIMNEINKYRAANGLSAVKTSTETCNFAKTRAQEIVGNFNHDGFTQRLNNRTLPYASWSKVTENIAMTSNYKDVVRMWENSSGHAENMRADTPYVCVEQSGNYYAYVGMKP